MLAQISLKTGSKNGGHILGNDLENQYLSSDMENKNQLLKILYRTTKIDESGLDIPWSPGWDELVRLKEIELGQRLEGGIKKLAPRVGLEPTT
jgi:hypothetical protein